MKLTTETQRAAGAAPAPSDSPIQAPGGAVEGPRPSAPGGTINHPPHYAYSEHEPIDVIEAWQLGFCLGNTVKYIARAGRKGDALEDLRKARWYLDREIARRGTGRWMSARVHVAAGARSPRSGPVPATQPMPAGRVPGGPGPDIASRRPVSMSDTENRSRPGMQVSYARMVRVLAAALATRREPLPDRTAEQLVRQALSDAQRARLDARRAGARTREKGTG